MAKAKKTEVKGKSSEALREDLKNKRLDLFKAQMDHERRKLKNTTSLTTMRKDIARMLTHIKMLGMSAKPAVQTKTEQSVRQAQDKKEVTNG